jgi:hypothetical protein
VVAGPSNALALPDDLLAELAAEAKDAAAKERPAVSRLSLKSGVMSYMQQPVAQNKMDVIIISGAYWHKFYSGRYDPNNTVNPTCFAISADSAEGMEPHDNVEAPVHEDCDNCPNFQWGSDPGGGRGKACKETRRLVVIPAAAAESAELIKSAEMAIIDVPVTSVRNYANYVNTIQATISRPMWAIITTLQVVPDARTQFKLTFTPIAALDNADVLRAVRGRVPEALRAATIPYDEAYLQGESGDKNAAPTNKPRKF